MSAADSAIFLLQIAVMLACAWLGGYCMLRLGQPVVLGEMVAGIVLGPTIVGWLMPDAYAALFTSSPSATLLRGGLTKLGMLFFLFLVGLEIHFGQLARHGKTAIAVGLLGTAVPLGMGMAVVYVLPDIWGPQAAQHRFAFALFIGSAMANTANPVLARILLDLGLLKRDIGAVLMTATVVDDLVSWSLLVMVLGQFSAEAGQGAAGQLLGIGSVLGFFLALLLVGRFVILPALSWCNRALRRASLSLVLISIAVLLSAALAEKLELHAFLGPFVLGIAVAASRRELGGVYQSIHEFVVGFFVPIYFVTMGLTSNFLRDFDLVLVVVILAVASVSKIGSTFIGAICSGLDRRTALGVGFGMNARGATGIILAALGRDRGVIDEPVYVALVLMAIATSIVAVPTMKVLLRDQLALVDADDFVFEDEAIASEV